MRLATKMATITALFSAIGTIATGCEKDEGAEQPAEPPAAEEVVEIAEPPEAQPPPVPATPRIVEVKTLTRSVLYKPAPPEGAEGDEPVAILEFEDFPGETETIKNATLAKCFERENKKDPYVVTYHRRTYDDGATEVGIVDIEECPNFPEVPPDEAKLVGWEGKGFYKVEGERGPLEKGWATFCGPESGKPCAEQPTP